MARTTETVRLNKVISRVEAPADWGLTQEQARERLQNGYNNFKPDSAEKTIGQIIKDNSLTYFNLVYVLLSLCVLAAGSLQDLSFLPLVLVNTTIGIIQELRSKRALSKLSFISAPNATVIRDRQRMTVQTDHTVLDDIAVFTTGDPIYADAIVLSGECTVNEALVTGESDEITKTHGDTLLSGSFIVSGECAARLERVGRDSFIAQLTLEAKKTRGKRRGMIPTLQRLVQIIGILIIPVGIAVLYRHLQSPPIGISEDMRLSWALLGMVGALDGMIPGGLYLLASVTLTVSVVRLARKKTLVQGMNSVETLARVDVLCVDKTGTITENQMEVKGTALLNADRYNTNDINMIMFDYVGNIPADNETMIAIQSSFSQPPRRRAQKVAPFSSAVKYSGVSFGNSESYLLGAPERILLSKYAQYKNHVDHFSAQGYRVLLLAMYSGDIHQRLDDNRVVPLALIMLSNKVRAEAPGTFRYFVEQGVKIIVISGDNPVTVSQIAKEAGIVDAERYVDAAELQTDRQIKRAVGEYVVFGRVTPDQKRKLVRALKSAGHTVAMTGDGVNDVLALKDADCSIAMAEGSEAATQVANIVLLDSDFSSMPAVVMEGRRVINNIERSAALYIMKNIFSFLAAVILTGVLAYPFHLTPSRLMLFSMLIIGVPSFVLALQSNTNLVKGKFIINVFRLALPMGLTSFFALAVLSLIDGPGAAFHDDVPTMASVIITFIGFVMLYRLCRPLNPMRITLIVCMLLGFTLGWAFLGETVFNLSPLGGDAIWITIAFCIASAPVLWVLSILFESKSAKGTVNR